jgi:alkylhydroperoxidase/carboxymuconolactone decarboxylase family protein YurZ
MSAWNVVPPGSGPGDVCQAGDISFDVLEHPKLSQRDRNLITVAFLVALNRTAELPFHVKRALESGVSRQEVIELVAHLAHHVPQVAPCAPERP